MLQIAIKTPGIYFILIWRTWTFPLVDYATLRVYYVFQKCVFVLILGLVRLSLSSFLDISPFLNEDLITTESLDPKSP